VASSVLLVGVAFVILLPSTPHPKSEKRKNNQFVALVALFLWWRQHFGAMYSAALSALPPLTLHTKRKRRIVSVVGSILMPSGIGYLATFDAMSKKTIKLWHWWQCFCGGKNK